MDGIMKDLRNMGFQIWVDGHQGLVMEESSTVAEVHSGLSCYL